VTPHQYLAGILLSQAMRPEDLTTIRLLREKIEGDLRNAYGWGPRIYYGGSYGKSTMIREAFDLDLVIYFPSTEYVTLRELFTGVNQALRAAGYIVEPKTVALRLPYQSEFHVDVVPGRAQDATFRYATLFKNTTPASTLQTSLKVHIDAVRKTGLADIIRLLKLWRRRHGVPLTTFALEILAARALSGWRRDDYGVALNRVFEYIEQNLSFARLEDPANTNNIVELDGYSRTTAVAHARQALGAQHWGQIVW
jgi:hypothetical protein